MTPEPVHTAGSRRGWWIAGGVVGVIGLCCLITLIGGAALYAYTAPRVEATLSAMTSVPYGEYGQPPAAVTVLAPDLPPTVQPAQLPPATNLTNNAGRSEAPQLAWDGQGNLHVVWLDSSLRGDDGSMDVLDRVLQPDGQWSAVTNLTDGFGTVIGNDFFLVPAPSGGICALWQGSLNATMPAYYQRCLASGQWGEARKVNVGGDPVMNIAPAADPGGALHVLHSTVEAWYLGETSLISGDAPMNVVRLVIDASGGFHVLWQQYGQEESLHYRFSPDGQTWQPALALTSSDDAPTGSTFQVSAGAQGDLHLAWTGQEGLFYRRWTPDGGWQPAQKVLNNQEIFGGAVALAVDAQGQPHLLFPLIMFGPPALGYIHQGADDEWTQPRPVAMASGGSQNVSLYGFAIAIAADGTPHFVWQAQDTAAQGTADLYHAALSER